MGNWRQDRGPGVDAEEALSTALKELAAVATVKRQTAQGDGERVTDLALTMSDGRKVGIEVQATAHPGPAECRALVEEFSRTGRQAEAVAIPMVVADKLSLEAQRVLAGAAVSFFDRRGRLVLIIGDRIIEADVTPAPRPRTGGSAMAVRGTSGLSAGLAALLSPERPFGVREAARAAFRCPRGCSRCGS